MMLFSNILNILSHPIISQIFLFVRSQYITLWFLLMGGLTVPLEVFLIFFSLLPNITVTVVEVRWFSG